MPASLNNPLPHPAPPPPRPQLQPQAQPLPNAVALRLGYVALIPFILGAALVWIVRAEVHAPVAAALSGYAAVVVSFLGGIHWGFGMRQANAPTHLFAWGVAPSIAAWLAVLMPPDAGLVVHGLLLVLCYLVDRKVYPTQGAGAWLTMRFRLSVLASLSCFVGAAGSI